MKRLFFILASVMMTASVWAGEASYKVVSVRPAYDAKVNGMSGIRFRILANIYDCQGKEVYCEGSLYYKDSSGEWPGVPYCPNGNNDYARVDLRSESGFVPRGKSLSSYTCESEASSHVFEVFIPYNAITHPAGHVDYQLELTFREAKDNKLIKNKEKREFVYPHPFALEWPKKEESIGKLVSVQLPNSLWGIALGDSKNRVEQKLRNAGLEYTLDDEQIKSKGLAKTINVLGIEYHKITIFLRDNRVGGIALYKVCTTSTVDAVKEFMKQTEENYSAFYDEELTRDRRANCQICVVKSYSEGQKMLIQQYDITEKLGVMFSFVLLSRE